MRHSLGYSPPMSETADALREAILASGETRYAIAKRAGLAESQLARLMSGERSLSLESAEALARALGLRIELTRPKRRRKG